MHLITLHEHGSSNPLGVTANSDRVYMHPYYTFKDLVTIFLFFLVLGLFLFYAPNKLGQTSGMAVQQCKLLNYDIAVCWDSLDRTCTRNVSAILVPWRFARLGIYPLPGGGKVPFSVKINSIVDQSAGNLRNFYSTEGSSETTRDISDLTLSKSNTNDVNDFNKDEDFNYWLAGLIDGDGTLSIYKNNAQVCEITLGEEDVKTLHKIKQKFHGSVLKRSKVKAYRWRVSKKLYVTEVINSINGKLLTDSKRAQLIKVCNKLNIEPITNNKISKNNSWFTGFFDAEGYFSIRNNYTLTISVGQKSKEILEEIQKVFGVGNIYYDKSWNGYNYVITDLQGIKTMLAYFERYPLKTIKHPDFITIRRLVLFIERGYHLKNHPLKDRIDNLIKIFKNRKKR